MALKIRSCNLHSLEWSRSEGQGFLPLWKWCCSKGIMLIFSSKLLSWPTATSIFNLLLSSTKWILPTSLCWMPLCSSFLVVFLCFYTSYFFFYTVVSFSEELLLLCKERFRVHSYFCLSCKLRNTARKIYKHCTRPWSSSWKRTVKTVTFGTTKILSINLPLPDESLYACSFFFCRAGKLADCFISDTTSRFIFCDTTRLRRCCQSALSSQSHYWGIMKNFLHTANRNL